MTRRRNDNHSTEFGLWLRDQPEIDSKKGYTTTNVDYMWLCYNSGKWMFIEEKRYCSRVGFSQKECFKKINEACKGTKNYYGFHLIQFEKTTPDDGIVWLDNKQITKKQLINFLQFKNLP